MQEKVCQVCGIRKEISEFYAYRKRGVTVGYKPRCRHCVAKYHHARRILEVTQVNDRARYASNEAYRRQRREATQRWRRRNPEKVAAEHAVRLAIRRGEMTREGCEVCGAPAHAHHADYTQPLAVRWLCALHHMRRHVTEGRLDGLRKF